MEHLFMEKIIVNINIIYTIYYILYIWIGRFPISGNIVSISMKNIYKINDRIKNFRIKLIEGK